MKLSKERIEELIKRTSDDGLLNLYDELAVNAAMRELLALRQQNEWQPIEEWPTKSGYYLTAEIDSRRPEWPASIHVRYFRGRHLHAEKAAVFWDGQTTTAEGVIRWKPLPPIPLEVQKESGE